eukprot:CCRYP_016584-RA/>CCRYP_016584-RA protein AED:0.48 eAED:0.48 QI:0/-1/0/1/-1/0/1/0/6
MQDFHG